MSLPEARQFVNTRVESVAAIVNCMNALFDGLCGDLADETADLVGHLERLHPDDWDIMTASEPWTIKDQVSHLAWNDEAVIRAISDPEQFRRTRASSPAAIQAMVDQVITDNHDRDPADLLKWFQTARRDLLSTVSAVDPGSRMPWYGPDMSVTSKITARFMETWAHGFDIVGALSNAKRSYEGRIGETDRVRHVVFLGLQALPNAYSAQRKDAPIKPVRLEVVSPSGAIWNFGKPQADNVVAGSAYELALLVTQRCHRADTSLIATGPVADEWLSIAQAFAGPPGSGRHIGQTATTEPQK
jgi:uncharacterized protein (TIGR03084 family)